MSVLDIAEGPYLEALDRFSKSLGELDNKGKSLTSIEYARNAFAYQFGIFWYSMFREVPPTAGRDTAFVHLLESAGKSICDETISWPAAAKNAVAHHEAYLRAGDMFAWARMDCLVTRSRPAGDTVRMGGARPVPDLISIEAFSARKK